MEGFCISLATIPYLYHLSLVGLGVIVIWLLAKFRKLALDPIARWGFMLLSGLLALNVVVAVDRGEAFLQLANFFPFFGWFGVLPFLLKGIERLEQVAMALVLGSLPINVISVGEYILKAPWMPRDIRRLPWVAWVRSAPHKGRAMMMFGHPNAMASYLVVILGLGLGLILYDWVQRRSAIAPATPPSPWLRLKPVALYLATFLNLVGIFTAGSRNGLVIAIGQLLVFVLFARRHQRVVMTGLVGLVAVIGGAVALGIGGRSLLLSTWTSDPRIRVWQIALEMTQSRPWLGWGLGSYKLLYPSYPHDPEYSYIGHPHNFWLLLSSEAGLPVMLLFTGLVGYCCYRGARAVMLTPKPIEQALFWGYAIAFAGCIGFSLFDVTLYNAQLNLVNWLVLAGIYSFARSQ
ncbi:MAG: O-antigen ligase family protein [Leptolyngbyaceae cyanobacterium SL_7_1]|nr:O-antigen ligase family protein [Leptolyngbyaceae cyanobacterium SL_7_1]